MEAIGDEEEKWAKEIRKKKSQGQIVLETSVQDQEKGAKMIRGKEKS